MTPPSAHIGTQSPFASTSRTYVVSTPLALRVPRRGIRITVRWSKQLLGRAHEFTCCSNYHRSLELRIPYIAIEVYVRLAAFSFPIVTDLLVDFYKNDIVIECVRSDARTDLVNQIIVVSLDVCLSLYLIDNIHLQ